jgi:MFS family permease
VTPPGTPGPRVRGVLPVLFAGVLMEALDIAMLGPGLPAIRDAFALDDRAAAWVFGVFVLFNLVGTPLMAKLSDRFGRRVVYTADVALFAVGSIIVAAAPSFAVLLGGRALQGLGAGGTFPVASATIGDLFAPERRGRALGLIGSVFGVAFVVGPIVAGILLLVSWRLLFLVSLPIAAWVLYAAPGRLPGHARRSGPPFDSAGLATLAALLAAVAWALNRIDAADLAGSLARPDIWGPLAAAAGLSAVLHVVEHRAADPILPPTLVRSRPILIAAALSAGAGLAEAGFIFMPAMLEVALDVSLSTASFMLLPLVVAMGIGAPVGGRLLDRRGARPVALGAALVAALGAATIATFEGAVRVFYAGSIGLGLGLGALLGSVLRYVMLQNAPPTHRGAAQGLVTVFISIGQLAGSAVLGALIASGGSPENPLAGYAHAFGLAAATFLVLMIAAFGLRTSRAPRPAD